MKCSILLAAAAGLAGCATDTDPFPPAPPSGDQNPVPGGPVQVGGDDGMVTGRVCLISDAWAMGNCAPAGAGGLTVTLGTGGPSAITADDGTFTLPTPTPSSSGFAPMFSVTGDEIVQTNMVFGASTNVPVLATDTYDQMLASVEYQTGPSSGGILASVAVGTGALPNVSVTSTPGALPGAGPFYDTATAGVWGPSPTGAAGTIWMPGLTPGPTSLQFDNLTDNTEQLVDGIQVLDGGVTVVNATFAPPTM